MSVTAKEDVFLKIGEELRIPMWLALTEQQKTAVMTNDREAAVLDYFECKHDERSNTLNIIPFDPYGMYDVENQCVYSFDLHTLKPTDTSSDRTLLSDALSQQIKRLYTSVKWMKIDNSMTKQEFVALMDAGYRLHN